MNEIVERFEVTFNQIHQLLKELNGYPKNDNFVELLNRSKVKHSVIRTYFDQLKQYAKLRNAIVHERVDEDYYIATPHIDVVEQLEHIKQTLEQPPQALDFATRPVMFFTADTPLVKVIDAFERHRVSQFPIYTKDHQFLGLLTNGCVVRWLSRSVREESESLYDVMAEQLLDDEYHQNVQFLARNGTVFDLEERFENSLEENRKLKAVLITESGDKDGPPMGIVTTWDLIKIDRGSDDE
ncbi:CBS domain-containing protein [Halobacillus fulvus]|nr:CBS domain-containing protein [Halobacillus fulvus]